MSKKQPTRGESLAKAIISEYKPRSVEDMQNALKDVFGPMFEAMRGYTAAAGQIPVTTVRLCTR